MKNSLSPEQLELIELTAERFFEIASKPPQKWQTATAKAWVYFLQLAEHFVSTVLAPRCEMKPPPEVRKTLPIEGKSDVAVRYLAELANNDALLAHRFTLGGKPYIEDLPKVYG